MKSTQLRGKMVNISLSHLLLEMQVLIEHGVNFYKRGRRMRDIFLNPYKADLLVHNQDITRNPILFIKNYSIS